MNKNCYRVIFSRTKGQLVVVAENVASQRKTHSQATGVRPSQSTMIGSVRRLSFSLWLAMGWVLSGQPVLADIVADPNAPGNQQATVLNAGNGTPLVNIQTPSAGGVSRNVYSQFDVQQQGAILNNSRTDVQTQLGGYVQGNPWLATGSAKVILNEVNSSNPSQLQGYVEVAGNRAEVVIANPSGISCNGCGFINANRATLTTGQTQLNGGVIQGYQVQRGEISVNGSGLDGSQSDYTDLIARSVKVNAAIHANQLKVSTGAHQTDAVHETVTATQPTGQTPTMAIDVAQLGGMYANKITLIGTEAGVGVRNAGHIGASTGDVVINNNGTLENIGQINASQNLNLSTQGDLNNSGIAYAQANTQINTAATLNNSGTIAAQQNTVINANNIQSSGALAAGVNQQGTAVNAANLQVNANETLIASGQNLATEQQTLTAKQIDLSHSETTAKNLTITASQAAINLDNAKVLASQNLTANTQTTLSNRQGQVAANQLTLTAHDLDNSGGELVQTGNHDLTLNLAGQINNQQGRIASNGSSQIKTSTLLNQAGQLYIANAGNLTLDVAGALDNSQNGQIIASHNLAIVSGEVLNQRGLLQAANNLTLNSQGQLDNRDSGNKSGILAGGSLSLSAAGINNQSGYIGSQGDLTAIVSDVLDNQLAGQILSQTNMRVNAAQLDNRSGQLQAQGDLNLLLTDTLDNRASVIRAGQTLTISADSVDNRNTQNQDQGLEAKNLSLSARQIKNQQGAMRANQQLTIRSAERLDNSSGLISSLQNLTIQDPKAEANNNPTNKTLNITNTSGTLIAGNQLNIDSAGLSGDGKVLSETDITLKLTQDYIHSSNAQLQANQNIRLETLGTLNNQGLIQAGSQFSLTAANIDNRYQSKMLAERVDLKTTGTLDNRGLINGNQTYIDALTLNNLGSGQIYGDQLAIQANTLNNLEETVNANTKAAVIAARERLDIGAQTITNREHSMLFSLGDIVIGGQLDANHQAVNQAGVLNNNSATIEAMNDLALSVGEINNTNQHLETQQVLVLTEPKHEYQGQQFFYGHYADPNPQRYQANQVLFVPDTLSQGLTRLLRPNTAIGISQDYMNYYEYQFTRSVTETQVSKTDPGQILAGGAMRINGGALFNLDSQIIAGAKRVS
jgi:filamentous hemagglutinin